MSPVKNAIVAAAGLGSRLGLGMPKCMISINRHPILSRTLTLLSAHVENIVVVAGYREELVIEYCQSHFREVVVARNPDFATTNTAHSLSLGARLISGKTIFLDGDLLLEKPSLERFLRLAQNSELLLGVAEAKTEQPVYAECKLAETDYLKVTRFSREQATAYEWANLFVGPHDVMDNAQRYVFEKLGERLPLPAALIEVEEVDTPDDMKRAEAAVQKWDAQKS